MKKMASPGGQIPSEGDQAESTSSPPPREPSQEESTILNRPEQEVDDENVSEERQNDVGEDRSVELPSIINPQVIRLPSNALLGGEDVWDEDALRQPPRLKTQFTQEGSFEAPVSLSRALSRQAQTPAWLTNEMTSLGVVNRSTSVASRSTTPKPPLHSHSRNSMDEADADEGTGPSGASNLGEDESRMLRHLEQHAHLKEEMLSEEAMNPHRAEQIRRENNRLLHIAMRRDRYAKKEARAKGGHHRETEEDERQAIVPPIQRDATMSEDSEHRDDDDDEGSSSPRPTFMREDSEDFMNQRPSAFVPVDRPPTGASTSSRKRLDDDVLRQVDEEGFGSKPSERPKTATQSRRKMDDVDELLRQVSDSNNNEATFGASSERPKTATQSRRKMDQEMDEVLRQVNNDGDQLEFGLSMEKLRPQKTISSKRKLEYDDDVVLDHVEQQQQQPVKGSSPLVGGVSALPPSNANQKDDLEAQNVEDKQSNQTDGHSPKLGSVGHNKVEFSKEPALIGGSEGSSNNNKGASPFAQYKFGFGYSPFKGSASLNASSRRRRGLGHFGSSTGPKRQTRRAADGNLPPSFTGARQRQRLLGLFKHLDLMDAPLILAIKRIQPLHPQGVFRRNWDKLLALCVFYTLIAVPFEVAFESSEIAFRVIDVGLDVIFIVDVFLTFRTSYREVNDEYVRDFDQIARHYARTWLVFDLIAAIPVNIIFLIVSSFLTFQAQNYFSLFKLIKVFRIVRLRHLFHALAGLKVSVYIYLFAFVSGFVLAAHWFACIFWKIAVLEDDSGEDSWVSLLVPFPEMFNGSIAEQYALSMYWSLATISTLGYGDVRPRTYAEQIYTSIVVIVGASLYAAVIGLVSYMVRGLFESELQRENHAKAMQTFGRHYHLPPQLQDRIRKYFEFLWDRKKRFTTKSLADDLPLELRADVADAIHKKLIEKNPVLRACTSFGFKKLFAARLSNSIIRIPEDVLYFEGDEVMEIFFIKKGMVDIIFGLDRGGESEFTVARRTDGQYLGDMGLFVETLKTVNNETIPLVDQIEGGGAKGFHSTDEETYTTEEDSDDDEGTEASGAPHFGFNDDSTTKKKKKKSSNKKKQRKSLHHTSAMVVQFSDISSILATDFMQLLDQFPREKKLFTSVAMARFHAVKDCVAYRFQLQQQQQQEQQNDEEKAAGEATPAAAPPPSASARRRMLIHQSSPGLGALSSSSLQQQQQSSTTNDAFILPPGQTVDASTPLNHQGLASKTSPRIRQALAKPFASMLRSSRPLDLRERLLMYGPEADDELVHQTVSDFLTRELENKSSLHRRRDKKSKTKKHRADSILMTPVQKLARTFSSGQMSSIPTLDSLDGIKGVTGGVVDKNGPSQTTVPAGSSPLSSKAAVQSVRGRHKRSLSHQQSSISAQSPRPVQENFNNSKGRLVSESPQLQKRPRSRSEAQTLGVPSTNDLSNVDAPVLIEPLSFAGGSGSGAAQPRSIVYLKQRTSSLTVPEELAMAGMTLTEKTLADTTTPLPSKRRPPPIYLNSAALPGSPLIQVGHGSLSSPDLAASMSPSLAAAGLSPIVVPSSLEIRLRAVVERMQRLDAELDKLSSDDASQPSGST